MVGFGENSGDFFWENVRPTPPGHPHDFSFPPTPESQAWVEAAFSQDAIHSPEILPHHLNFSLTAASFAYLLGHLPSVTDLELRAPLRSSHVATFLREPRRQLRRWSRLVAPRLENQPPLEHSLDLQAPWRDLAVALLVLAARLRQHRDPWAATALAKELSDYLQAWRTAWQESVLDGDGPAQTRSRLFLLAQAADFQKGLLVFITP